MVNLARNQAGRSNASELRELALIIPDISFRPMKERVSPTGSDGESEPWLNIVVEATDHVLEKAKEYLLPDMNRAHDGIVIKIDKVPDSETPSCMQVNCIN
ncbi:hypothetical protein GLOIN_2v1709556 [Rhizophagus clarus]|uniref:Uncharacterized protein n=1 Tax=Rhizophagus clarus TaxID=94130 RepID=A0A8H3R2B1_9GLOM|nr:hypothetical protein GLOIN_2v1709556 [Rhizophagus clarus]